MTNKLTDAELVRKAYEHINRSDIKDHMPRNYSLMDLWRASRAVVLAGIAFVDEHGERLEKLDPVAYRALREWEDYAI